MKLWSIQILRFYAALAVVYFHATSIALEFTPHPGLLRWGEAAWGQAGVDLFFVISGFVIARTSRGLSARAFIVKRAQRILPLHFLFAALWMALLGFTIRLDWRNLISTWLLWPVTDRITAPLNPVAWSLCFEVLFYAAFSVILWRRWSAAPILALFVFAMALRSIAPVFAYLGNPLILEFLAGVALAYARPWRPAVWALPLGCALFLFFVILGVAPFDRLDTDYLAGRHGFLRAFTIGVPSVLVVWGTLQLQAKVGLLTYLGDASYSLYLAHLPVVFAVDLVLLRFTPLPADLVILLAIAASLLAAWRVHELFEKPVLDWLKKPRQALAGEEGARRLTGNADG